MDREQKKKWHKVGVICAEFIMVVAVIAIVVVTTLIAMGYNLNREGEVEQSGLLQLHTMPTGATVEIDGETMFARSNMSRNLSPGTHHLKVSRDEYDSWERDIEMTSGWLSRIYYPRLFLTERKAEQVVEWPAELEFSEVSPDRETLLWAENDSTTWQLMDISGDEAKLKTLDMTALLGDEDGRFSGELRGVEWSVNGEKILTRVVRGENTEWWLFNLKDLEESVNLTATFGLQFTQIKAANDTADKLIALENGNIRTINVSGQELSRILLEKVEDFDNLGASIAYIIQADDSGVRAVGTYNEGEKQGVTIESIAADAGAVKIATSHYYGDDYLTVVAGVKLKTYYGTFPTYREGEKTKVSEALQVLTEKELKTVPEQMSGSRSGEYVWARAGQEFSLVDLDRGDLYEYAAPSAEAKWLDDSMFYAVVDGAVKVWDYDGANERELAKNATARAVTIGANERYLYYGSTADEQAVLMRERIVK